MVKGNAEQISTTVKSCGYFTSSTLTGEQKIEAWPWQGIDARQLMNWKEIGENQW